MTPEPKNLSEEQIFRAAEDDVENPPLTDAEIHSDQWTTFDKAYPSIAQGLKTAAKRGRPTQGAQAKVSVTMRLDADLVQKLRESGRGWQTAANAELRKAFL